MKFDYKKLKKNSFYKLHIRSTIATGVIYEWFVSGSFGGEGISSGGRINYSFCILPHTQLLTLFPDRDTLIGVLEIHPTYKEVGGLK
jgi:hypothetical protein